MPLYPAYLAIFYDPSMSDPDYFIVAKRWNIRLSLAMLVVLGFLFTRYLPPLPATNLILVVAFGYFVFKAGYTQPELLLFHFLTSWPTCSTLGSGACRGHRGGVGCADAPPRRRSCPCCSSCWRIRRGRTLRLREASSRGGGNAAACASRHGVEGGCPVFWSSASLFPMYPTSHQHASSTVLLQREHDLLHLELVGRGHRHTRCRCRDPAHTRVRLPSAELLEDPYPWPDCEPLRGGLPDMVVTVVPDVFLSLFLLGLGCALA